MKTRIPALSVGLSVMLTACTSATAAPAVLPTDTPAPELEFESFPAANCCNGRTVEAGKYQVPEWLGVPLNVQINEDWRMLNEAAAGEANQVLETLELGR